MSQSVFIGRASGGGGGGSSFRQSFTDASLVAGVLTVAHGLGERYNTYAIYDDSDEQVVPDDATAVAVGSAAFDLSTIQAALGGSIPGTWQVVVVA